MWSFLIWYFSCHWWDRSAWLFFNWLLLVKRKFLRVYSLSDIFPLSTLNIVWFFIFLIFFWLLAFVQSSWWCFDLLLNFSDWSLIYAFLLSRVKRPSLVMSFILLPFFCLKNCSYVYWWFFSCSWLSFWVSYIWWKEHSFSFPVLLWASIYIELIHFPTIILNFEFFLLSKCLGFPLMSKWLGFQLLAYPCAAGLQQSCIVAVLIKNLLHLHFLRFLFYQVSRYCPSKFVILNVWPLIQGFYTVTP